MTMDQTDKNAMSFLKNYIAKTYQKEIEEENELERKYKLNHTPEEIERRKEFQEKFKFYHLKQRRIYTFKGLIKTYRWFRKNYFNFNVKQTIEEYEYYKYLRFNYLKIIAQSMFQSLGYSLAFYIWMRFLKHKGRKDLAYMFMINAVTSLVLLNTSNNSC
jgi:hypothetical protein